MYKNQIFDLSSNLFYRHDIFNDISQFKIIFGDREIPFWNQINGPIEDAVWHCGQVISFRRSSGNPYNSKASLFTGKLRD